MTNTIKQNQYREKSLNQKSYRYWKGKKKKKLIKQEKKINNNKILDDWQLQIIAKPILNFFEKYF